jgi:hypothetical protein
VTLTSNEIKLRVREIVEEARKRFVSYRGREHDRRPLEGPGASRR